MYVIGGYEGDQLDGVGRALVSDAQNHHQGVVIGRMRLREIAMEVLRQLDRGDQEEIAALCGSEPGFAQCPECGNLAMNPLPSCGTCGEPQSADAVDPHAASTGKPSTRDE